MNWNETKLKDRQRDIDNGAVSLATALPTTVLEKSTY